MAGAGRPFSHEAANMTPALSKAWAAFEPRLPLAVALSGGADSTALLCLSVQRWPGQVVALHVNHGLQAAATTFEAHCQALCEQLQVPLRVAHVDAHAAPGQSPEDAARRVRYKALKALSADPHEGAAIENIAIAQHADDQVETVMLALSRGAGLAGLSGMPAAWQRDGLHYHRPLLHVPGADLRAYLQTIGQDFVTDPTNADEHYTRNRIRARLLPAWQSAFPAFRETIARSAAHAAQAQTLLDEVASQDLQGLKGNEGIVIQGLQSLSPARRANVVRHWLKVEHACIPSAAQLEALLLQIEACRTRGHQIHLKVGEGFVQRKNSMLSWYNRQVLL
jgi:tRNA(Ile)-lysidine synthase